MTSKCIRVKGRMERIKPKLIDRKTACEECAVGTLDDWEEYARNHGYDGLQWKESGIKHSKDIPMMCECGEFLDGALTCPKCGRKYDGN